MSDTPTVLTESVRYRLRRCLGFIPHEKNSLIDRWMTADTLDTGDLDRLLYSVANHLNELTRERDQLLSKLNSMRGRSEKTAELGAQLSQVVEKAQPDGPTGSLLDRVTGLAEELEAERTECRGHRQTLAGLGELLAPVAESGAEKLAVTVERLVVRQRAVEDMLAPFRRPDELVTETLGRLFGDLAIANDQAERIAKLAAPTRRAGESLPEVMARLVAAETNGEKQEKLLCEVALAVLRVTGRAVTLDRLAVEIQQLVRWDKDVAELLTTISDLVPVEGTSAPADLVSRVRRAAEEYRHFRMLAEQGRASRDGLVAAERESREAKAALASSHESRSLLRARLGKHNDDLQAIAKVAGWVAPRTEEDEEPEASAEQVLALVRALAKRAHVAERNLARARKGRRKANLKKEEVRTELEQLRLMEAELLVALGQPGLASEDIVDAVQALRALAQSSPGKDAVRFVRRTPGLPRREEVTALTDPAHRPEEHPLAALRGGVVERTRSMNLVDDLVAAELAARPAATAGPLAAEGNTPDPVLAEHCEAADETVERALVHTVGGGREYRRVYRRSTEPPPHVLAVRGLGRHGTPGGDLLVRAGRNWTSPSWGEEETRGLIPWAQVISDAEDLGGFGLVFDCTHEMPGHYRAWQLEHPSGGEWVWWVFTRCRAKVVLTSNPGESASSAMGRATAAARARRVESLVTRPGGPNE